eukprot:TRINITY_DN26584_c0_g1_i1.p1 TRINITY_DN26584_c0_g1~~TRINITY_DN26584_c0_g1_i1.p1  ORF type:complete len:342 (+),score=50.50 TRINITY_DN26584_c0_g1_i1:68-1027(+)
METSLPPAEWGSGDVDLVTCSEDGDEVARGARAPTLLTQVELLVRRRSIGALPESPLRSRSPEQLEAERKRAIQMEIERDEDMEREEHERARAEALEKERERQAEANARREQRERERLRELELQQQLEKQLREQREAEEQALVEKQMAARRAAARQEERGKHEEHKMAQASLFKSMSEMVGEQSKMAEGQIHRLNQLILDMDLQRESRERQRNVMMQRINDLECKIECLSPRSPRALPCTPSPTASPRSTMSPRAVQKAASVPLDCGNIYFEVFNGQRPYYWHVVSGAVQWSRPHHPTAYVLPHTPDVIKMVTQMMRST